MRVSTRNDVRTLDELNYMFHWCIEMFGQPSEADERWTYGKVDDPQFGTSLCNGTYDIGWYDFMDESDAIMFRLKFGL